MTQHALPLCTIAMSFRGTASAGTSCLACALHTYVTRASAGHAATTVGSRWWVPRATAATSATTGQLPCTPDDEALMASCHCLHWNLHTVMHMHLNRQPIPHVLRLTDGWLWSACDATLPQGTAWCAPNCARLHCLSFLLISNFVKACRKETVHMCIMRLGR